MINTFCMQSVGTINLDTISIEKQARKNNIEKPPPHPEAEAHHHYMTTEYPLCTKKKFPGGPRNRIFMTCLLESGMEFGSSEG